MNLDGLAIFGAMKTFEKRRCSGCQQAKPIDQFQFRKSRGTYRTKCRECCNTRSTRNREAKKGKREIPESKRCPRCFKTKKAAAFYRSSASKSGLTSWCRACYCRRESRKGLALSPEERRQKAIEKKLRGYGLTPATYEELLASQMGSCAVCDAVEDLCVDHCHETGRVRGILCRRCNLGLGHFRDDLELMRKALEYLEQS